MRSLVFFAVMMLQTLAVFSQQKMALSQPEADALVYMREEEKLARDVYDSLYAKWDMNPFGNIRQSEQVHMNRMATLISNYKLKDPVAMNHDRHGLFVNTTMQQYYNELVATGSRSVTDALKVGAKIEELDIADLEERMKQTTAPDILTAFEFLNMGSYNHLRAFVRRLKMKGVNYEPVILSKENFDGIIASENEKGGCGKGCK
jgi:hypothetical protein